MHDEQLREQFARWAQPVVAATPPVLPVLRRRARRRLAGSTVFVTMATGVKNRYRQLLRRQRQAPGGGNAGDPAKLRSSVD